VNTDWIYFEVQKNAIGTDIISNFVVHVLHRDYYPADTAFGDFNSTITLNNSTKIEGTLYGIVVDSEEISAQELTEGVINLNL
jgi:hypothetical protein